MIPLRRYHTARELGMEWEKLAVLAAIVGLIVLGVSGCTTPAREYIEADRATFDAIAPEYREYVTGDDVLSEIEKDVRLHTLQSWDERIAAAEEALNDE